MQKSYLSVLAAAALLFVSCGFSPTNFSKRADSGDENPPTAPSETPQASGAEANPQPAIPQVLIPETMPPVASGSRPAADVDMTLCAELDAVKNSETDATDIINTCIARTPDGGVLELPPGKYTLAQRLTISKALTLRTKGKPLTAPCSTAEDHDCAELRAGTALLINSGWFVMAADGTHIENIVINGRKESRPITTAKCREPGGAGYGYSIIMKCSNCSFDSSVSKNAVCGTSLEVSGPRANINVKYSRFAANGLHDIPFADGLTVHQVEKGEFIGNEFTNNTDVDFIFGGCRGCMISNNKVVHTGGYAQSSFAAMLFHAFAKSTSGHFTDSIIEKNLVDCGPNRGCGFGIGVGGRSWYDTNPVVNGTFRNNSVLNAQAGFVVGIDVIGSHIGDNDVGASGAMTCPTSGGPFPMHAFAVAPGSQAVFVGQRVGRQYYVEQDYVGKIPNYAPGCTPR